MEKPSPSGTSPAPSATSRSQQTDGSTNGNAQADPLLAAMRRAEKASEEVSMALIATIRNGETRITNTGRQVSLISPNTNSQQ